MTLHLTTLLEGSPSYGVLDAKDGVVLFRRPGHEAAFSVVAMEAMQAAGVEFTVIPISDESQQCDRLFIVPLEEDRSFSPDRLD